MTPQFAVIGLVVDDMAKTLAFYRRLGLDIPASADSEPHVAASLPGGLQIMWDTVDTVRSFDPTWAPPTGSPRAGLAFRCPTPSDVDRLYRELADFGHKEPWDAFWGQRYAVLHDPDGTGVDLFCPLEG
ncbi:VOC family protein [Kutzneria sp. CA-103260]|uniref:VOC family protein n=1 Tax=Kutzneria sp. CA-103260 TaxID=2802641 RepID=UPI001BA9C988|nr:VOC family protein [Kutzneria sp. CA-103260]QUQ71295.1 glyoxalase [Kutzneria sp. CA-103260]